MIYWYALYVISIPSRTLNVLTGGSFHETLSARTGRVVQETPEEAQKWHKVKITLDYIFILFEDDHCNKAVERHVEFNGLIHTTDNK